MAKNSDYLEKKSLEYRKTVLEIIYNSGAGHTGGSLSCVDILNVLYNNFLEITPKIFPQKTEIDTYKVKVTQLRLYIILCDQGFFTREELNTLNNFNSHFIGHPTKKVPGIEHNTGALGHGLSVAVGLAIAQKLNKENFKIYTLLGDGELSEGSVWEACISTNLIIL